MKSKRDAIVAAAAKVFREKGYYQSTTQDIAAEVGMLKGSLYYYISKKEDLLHAVVEKPVQEMVNNLREIARSPAPTPDKIRRLIADHLRTFDEHYPHIFVYLQEISHTTGADQNRPFSHIGVEYRRLIEQIICEGVARGELRADLDPTVTSLAIVGMCNWMHRWYRPSGKQTASAIAETFASIILDGLQTAPVPSPAAERSERTERTTVG